MTGTVKIPEEVTKFAFDRSMSIAQNNGQRLYGPMFGLDPSIKPVKGTEVYVSKLPRRMLEPDLVPVFEQPGPIYQLRLMMDFSGTHKGYCFVKYFTLEQANQALRILNGYTIKEGVRIMATRSVDNCRLELTGIPVYKTPQEVYEEVQNFCGGGVSRVWKTWSLGPQSIKGMALVDFDSHQIAAIVRSKILSRKCNLWGFDITVDWAEPEISTKFMNQPNVLRVANLPGGFKNSWVYDIFNPMGSKVVIYVKRSRSKAFIYFPSRGYAEAAKLAMNDVYLGGKKLQVGWGDPRTIKLTPRERRLIEHRLEQARERSQLQLIPGQALAPELPQFSKVQLPLGYQDMASGSS